MATVGATLAMIPDAESMAEAIQAACNALLEEELIPDGSYPTLGQALGELKARGKDSKSWAYSISAATPLMFSEILNEDLNQIIAPRIYLKVDVDESLLATNKPPFSKLNCVLEVANSESGEIILSTHVDLAEKDANGAFQHAPLFHMQIGGHRPGADRSKELRLKEPRLMHPPLDLLLAIEIVVANFYPKKWENLVQLATWNEAMNISQQLCYSAYTARFNSSLGISTSTAMRALWAAHWQ